MAMTRLMMLTVTFTVGPPWPVTSRSVGPADRCARDHRSALLPARLVAPAPLADHRHRLPGELALLAPVAAHRGHRPALGAAPGADGLVGPGQGPDRVDHGRGGPLAVAAQ